MTTQTGTVEQTEACDIHTCGRPRRYFVTKLDNTRGVCSRCMEELVTAFGWKLVGGQLTKPASERPVVRY